MSTYFRTLSKNTLLILTLVFLTVSAQAATKGLSTTTINHWIDSLTPVQNWAKTHQAEFAKANKDKAPDTSAKGMVTTLKDAGLYNDAAKLMKKYGFHSPEQWANTQHRIIQAMMAIQMKKRPNAFNAEKQLARVKNNPNIPAQQKARMIQLIKSTERLVKDAKNVTPADKTAVKPFMKKIIEKMNHSRARGASK